MNFTLIPFFLAVNVTLDDPSAQWIHGPEYVFHVNVTYLVYPRAAKEPAKVSETFLLKCRPESDDRLRCVLEGRAIETSDEDASSEELPERSKVDLPFLIVFNSRGVESMRFPYLMDNLDLYIFRSVVKQLSVGADFRENANALFGFEAVENYVLGECTTWFRVAEYDKSKKQSTRGRPPVNFELELLTLNGTRSDPVFVIEKKIDSRRCVTDSRYSKQNFDVEAVNKMHVSDDVFRSRNEVHVKRGDTKKLIFHDVTCLELLRIAPAKEPLPSMSFEHVMPLHFEGAMDVIFRGKE